MILHGIPLASLWMTFVVTTNEEAEKKMNRRTSWWTVVAMLTLTTMLCSVPARAEQMTVGKTISLVFPAPAGNLNLAASGTMKLSTLNQTSATFDITISNDTLLSGDPGARLTAFGFLLKPAPTASSITIVDIGGVADVDAFVLGGTPANVPSLNNENVCTWTGNNCSGGGSTGLKDGQSDKYQITLTGSFGSTVDVDNFGIKWQGCTGCSFEVYGFDPPPRVPEPATLSLTGAGLLGLFAIRRFRRTGR